MSIEVVSALLVPAVLALGWIFRLEGRLNSAEERLGGRIDAHQQHLEGLRSDVTYIRSRVDEALSRSRMPRE